MNRSGPPKRRKGLTPDPEKVRAFQRRARERARQEARERPLPSPEDVAASNPPRRVWRQRSRQRPGADGWKMRVFTLYGPYCVRCQHEGRREVRAAHAHHAVPVHTIDARGDAYADEFTFDARNGVPLCVGCHWEHEYGARDSSRLPLACLPADVVAWAREQGFLWKIERTYR